MVLSIIDCCKYSGTCQIWHTKGPGKCVELYINFCRMSQDVGKLRWWVYVNKCQRAPKGQSKMNSAGTEATLGDTHKTQNEQCRDTGNIGWHTQDTEWTVQGHRQHWVTHTRQQNGQCRNTGNIGWHTQDNRMDSAGTQATLGGTHKTQNEHKATTKKRYTEKNERWATWTPPKTKSN